MINNELITLLNSLIVKDEEASITLKKIYVIVNNNNIKVSYFKLLYHIEVYLQLRNIQYTITLTTLEDIVFKGFTIAIREESTYISKQQIFFSKSLLYTFLFLLIFFFILIFYKYKKKKIIEN